MIVVAEDFVDRFGFVTVHELQTSKREAREREEEAW